MKQIFGILIISILLVGCKGIKPNQKKVEFNQELADELSKMAEIDQLAAGNITPPESYKHLSLEQWKSFQDSVYSTHQIWLKEVFDKYGFVGYDLAGEKGSRNFWLMVQHSDHNPSFQKKVLRKMKIEVDKGNADSKIYALLVDRVKINSGKAQIYGTQVEYKMNPCRAIPKNLADGANVNKRREEVGLQPLEQYLNLMAIFNCDKIKKLNEKENLEQN